MMKKTFIRLAIFASLFSVATGCNGFLDRTPEDKFTGDIIWGNQEALEYNVYNFYAYLKYATEISDPGSFTDAYSDLVKSSSWSQYNHSFNQVLLQAAVFSKESGAGPFECWTTNYTRIKRCNEFLVEAPKHYDTFGKDWLMTREAEVRFFRAMCYFQLIRLYGGVVLRTEEGGLDQGFVEENNPNDANDKPRSSEKESWALVLSDLNFAAQNLPSSWEKEQSGRITKAGAYGYLSRAALWAGEWKAAADAADSCAKYGGALAGSYDKVFSDQGVAENLITVTFSSSGQTGLTHRHDQFFRPIGDGPFHNNATLYCAFGPTAEMVDEYEMADGSEFDWAVNGSDPYTGREPRFYATVLYNDALWEGRRIQTYSGGTDARQNFKRTGAVQSTTTGYFFRKFLTEDQQGWEKNGSSHFGIFLRYAEVLLNKAEALAQMGDLANATIELNKVRERVGLPGRATAASLEEFMGYIRHERIVELAGEGFRYWDLRRWRLAEDVINGQVVHGVDVTKKPDGTFSYTRIDVDDASKGTRVFPERYYYFAIPIAEETNNKLFGENNEGW